MEWEKTLDPRILSFLKKTDTILEPYDALDLLEILKLRAEKVFDKKKVDHASLRKVAQETSEYLVEKEVDIAESWLEVGRSL